MLHQGNVYIVHYMCRTYTCQCVSRMYNENMIGERLADARRRKGLTLADLAIALGDRYDHSVLSRVEANKSSLRLDGLIRAALELGVSTDYLLGLTDDPTPAAQLLEQMKRQEKALILMELTGPRAAAQPIGGVA